MEEAWGDSDYEYTMTIPPGSVGKLYRVLHVEVGDRRRLLKALNMRSHGNSCFSALGDFLDQNDIDHETFRWA